jgi:hypothetical protein
MKMIIAALTLSAALVAVSAFEASAQTTPSAPTNRERAQMAKPIPSCKGMDKTTQAYKDCMAERAKADKTKKAKSS